MAIRISALDIPHIIDKVTRYLSQHELTQCVRVSKEWNTWFIPALWKNINMKGISSSTYKCFQQYNHLVLSIDNFDKDLASISPTPTFPNLSSLKYTEPRSTNSEDDALILFVQATPSIKSLALTLSAMNDISIYQLLNTIGSLTHLSKVDLTCYNSIPTPSILQIVQACSRCEIIRLILGGQLSTTQSTLKETASNQLEYAKSAIYEMKPTKIRELSIMLSSSALESAILIPLLEKCPSLEKLGLEGIRNSGIFSQIADILKAGNCPLLGSLQVGAVLQYTSRNNEFAELIQSINFNTSTPNDGSAREDGKYLERGMTEKRGLQSVIVSSALKFERLWVQALISHHANTLVTVEVLYMSQGAIHLMSNLPHLRSFKGVYWLKARSDGEDHDPESLFKLDWKCTGLRNLEIALQLPRGMDEIDLGIGDNSIRDKATGYIFSQIGRLKELREWKLNSWGNLLSMERGYLVLLSELKKLKCLDLSQCPHIIFKEPEVEWILEHWTQLVEIKFYKRKFRHTEMYMDDPLRKAKSIILPKRPLMKIT